MGKGLINDHLRLWSLTILELSFKRALVLALVDADQNRLIDPRDACLISKLFDKCFDQWSIEQVSGDIAEHLKEAGVTVKPYSAVAEDIKAIAAAGIKLWMDPAKVMHNFFFDAFRKLSLAISRLYRGTLHQEVLRSMLSTKRS